MVSSKLPSGGAGAGTGNPTACRDSNDVSSYDSAVAALYSSTHQSATKEAIQQAAARRTLTLSDMRIYLQRIGNGTDGGILALDEDVSIVHVAGTKGKGSVCSMCEAILRRHTDTTSRTPTITGLFTSPHLVDIRERIRINGKPVSKQVFGQAYWTVRRRLEAYDSKSTNKETASTTPLVEPSELPLLPGYFRMLTLVALYIFRHYQDPNGTPISYVILEVGMGGRYDATNAMIHPLRHAGTASSSVVSSSSPICGVTLIDYDHVRVLGSTLPEIAWEKGGVYQVDKSNPSESNQTPHPARERSDFDAALAQLTPASATSSFSHFNQQPPRHRCFALDSNDASVLQVLRLCAAREGDGCELQLTGDKSNNKHGLQFPSHRKLGLQGSHQRQNAALAIALCDAVTRQRHRVRMAVAEDHTTESASSTVFVNGTASLLVEESVYQALEDVSWPGRCQTVELPAERYPKPVTVRLDGAHTVQSMKAGLTWYQSVACNPTPVGVFRILVFNCSHERNPVELLQLLLPTQFRAVFFCRADSERPSSIAKAVAADLLESAGKLVNVELLKNSGDSNAPPTWQDTLLGIWNHLQVDSTSSTQSSAIDVASNLTVHEALHRGTTLSETLHDVARVEIFVSGSLYLVGSMLTAIEWSEPEAEGTLVDST